MRPCRMTILLPISLKRSVDTIQAARPTSSRRLREIRTPFARTIERISPLRLSRSWRAQRAAIPDERICSGFQRISRFQWERRLMDARFRATPDLAQARETANLIANAQISVYPISLLGLETGGVPVTSSGSGSVSLVGGPTGTHSRSADGRHIAKPVHCTVSPSLCGQRYCGSNGRRSICRDQRL